MTYDPKTFAWWKDALAGKSPPIHNDQAMQGYYAFRPSKNAPPLPVALWYSKDGELLCKIGADPHRHGLEIWLGCARNPIPYDVYQNVLAGGEWPNEIRIETATGSESSMTSGKRANGNGEDAGLGHNSGDDYTALTGNIKEWVQQGQKIVKKGAPDTKAEADAASDVATKLVELSQEADNARIAEGRPHFDRYREINGKWNEFISDAKQVSRDLKTLVGIFIKKENERLREEARKVQEAATAAGASEEVTIAAPEVRVGTRKAISMVSQTYVEISDRKKVFEYLAAMEQPPQDVMEAVEKACLRLLKASVQVPGAKLETRKVAR